MEKNVQNIYLSYILQFMVSARFMASLLSNLVNYLSEGFHKIKFKYGYEDKNCETFGINYNYCDCFLEYTNFKGNGNVCVVTKIINISVTKT